MKQNPFAATLYFLPPGQAMSESTLALVGGRRFISQAEVEVLRLAREQEQDIIDRLIGGATVEPGPLKAALRIRKKSGRRVYELEVE